ncbi:MAG: NTP transferase domain-containing protein, partial [Proteobacteria bacterium]|nr:NTP transferase domain-containing protein [Pseudomonadota bacterium]
MVRPVILSGGAGTRLWPLSVPDRPKQFLDLIGEPLFVQALQRLDGLEGVGDPVIVTGRDHLALVEEAIERANVAVHRILVEPTG